MIKKTIINKDITYVAIQFLLNTSHESVREELEKAKIEGRNYVEVIKKYKDSNGITAEMYMSVPIFLINECVGELQVGGFTLSIKNNRIVFDCDFATKTHIWRFARAGLTRNICNSCKIHLKGYEKLDFSYNIKISVPSEIYRDVKEKYKKKISIECKEV